MNESIQRIVTRSATTVSIKVQDAVVEPQYGHVIVPERVTPVRQGIVYQCGNRLPTPDGTPEEPLVIVAIEEEYDENGELAMYAVYSRGYEDSIFAKNNLGVITRVPADDVIRRDGVVPADEMIRSLTEELEEPEQGDEETSEPEEAQAEVVQPQSEPAQPPEDATVAQAQVQSVSMAESALAGLPKRNTEPS